MYLTLSRKENDQPHIDCDLASLISIDKGCQASRLFLLSFRMWIFFYTDSNMNELTRHVLQGPTHLCLKYFQNYACCFSAIPTTHTNAGSLHTCSSAKDAYSFVCGGDGGGGDSLRLLHLQLWEVKFRRRRLSETQVARLLESLNFT
jgi:hypothetical protein